MASYKAMIQTLDKLEKDHIAEIRRADTAECALHQVRMKLQDLQRRIIEAGLENRLEQLYEDVRSDVATNGGGGNA